MEEGPQERFVKVILSIVNALSQYVLCLFIKVSVRFMASIGGR